MVTINKKPDEANKNQTDSSDINQVADILEMGIQSRCIIYSICVNSRKKCCANSFYESYCVFDNQCSVDENDIDELLNIYNEYSQNEIINGSRTI
jgi:hypothetical protein